jgi:DHA1 family tetracycline resistance protein-like MFS transporter
MKRKKAWKPSLATTKQVPEAPQRFGHFCVQRSGWGIIVDGMPRKPPPVIGIALTVFIDLLSFGLVIPDIQLRGESLGARGAVLGLTIASFSIAQLLTAPFLGRWSDSIGRRKILLVTTSLAILSYLAYAHANTLWIMLAARILMGMAGANLGVAYAYIADVTTPKERGKAMGLIGAAFGLGFIFGPPFGAELVHLGHGAPIVLGYVSASLSALNFAYVYFFLQESLKLGTHKGEETAPTLANLARALRAPGLGLLLAMFFATNFGFSNLESTFFRYAEHEFNFSQLNTAMVLGVVGIVSAIMQGGVVRIVMPKFGEVNLLRFAYFCQVPGLALLPFAHPWVPMLLVTIVMGVGGGLAQPSMSSLISRTAPSHMQGGIFGVTQALGAMARTLGPLIGNSLFDVRHWLPYEFGACVVVVPMFAAWRIVDPSAREVATEGVLG